MGISMKSILFYYLYAFHQCAKRIAKMRGTIKQPSVVSLSYLRCDKSFFEIISQTIWNIKLSKLISIYDYNKCKKEVSCRAINTSRLHVHLIAWKRNKLRAVFHKYDLCLESIPWQQFQTSIIYVCRNRT